MIRRWFPIAAGAAAAGLAGVWLAFWLTGHAEIAAMRMKTNTSVGLVLLGVALVCRARGTRVAGVLANGASLIGALTLFQYVSGLSLGIDELIVRDAFTEESARFPNRMSPNAASGLILMGVSFALIASKRRALAIAGQVTTTAVFTVGFLAFIGYLHDVAVLYQPTSYIRMSFSTATALILLSSGLLSTRPDVGYMQVFFSDGPGGVLVRRLLPVGVILPVLLGRLEITLERQGFLADGTAESFSTLTLVAVFVLIIERLARLLDELHTKRLAAVAVTNRLELLTESLSLAATVDEVARASLEAGVPAFGGSAGVFFALDEKELRAVHTTGYSAEDARTFARVPLDSPLAAAHAVRELAPVFMESRDSFRGTSLTPLPGNEAWVALPLEGRGGRVLGVLGIAFRTARAFDAETRARFQRMALHCGQALDRAMLFDSESAARAKAESASLAKDEFLAMLGHELRNPLSPILTSLQLMKRMDPAPRRERDVIERQVQHMARLVDDLLDISRITRGKIALAKETIELSRVVSSAIEVSSPLLERKRHHLEVEVPATGLVVTADPQRLGQVVANLLMNAAKYTDDGGRIQVTARAEGADAVIRVRDSGAGIDPQLLPRVFDLFVQGDQTIERSAGGLGLGLAIARSLTELHGGRVSASSAGRGKGSEFEVRIPLQPADSVTAPPSRESAGRPLQGAARSRTILVVDDNVDAATMLAVALRGEGHRVEVAHDGVEALGVAARIQPELGFLDIGLPVMDGFELARQLRAAAGSRPLKLVAVTGYGQPADRERALAAGFDRHLVKPVPLEQVLSIAAEPSPRDGADTTPPARADVRRA